MTSAHVGIPALNGADVFRDILCHIPGFKPRWFDLKSKQNIASSEPSRRETRGEAKEQQTRAIYHNLILRHGAGGRQRELEGRLSQEKASLLDAFAETFAPSLSAHLSREGRVRSDENMDFADVQ
jgi:hypothetical protein